jgi:hypothetical protein
MVRGNAHANHVCTALISHPRGDIGLFWDDIWLRGAISEGCGKAPISPRGAISARYMAPRGHIGGLRKGADITPRGDIGSFWDDIWPRGAISEGCGKAPIWPRGAISARYMAPRGDIGGLRKGADITPRGDIGSLYGPAGRYPRVSGRPRYRPEGSYRLALGTAYGTRGERRSNGFGVRIGVGFAR